MNLVQKLSHTYGSSYFGSGGGYGHVKTSENARAVGSSDNGFMTGCDAVRVVDENLPARAYGSGGDCIGEGREWGEAWEWVPGHGWMKTKLPMDDRRSWLSAATSATGEALVQAAAAAAAAKAARIAESAAYAAACDAARAAACHAAYVAEEARRAEVVRLRAFEARQASPHNRLPKRNRAGGPGRCL
jgi:hypothetical protein